MRLVLRIKALLLRQKPLSDDEIWLCYMEAARHMKPTPLVEAKHGIVSRHEVRGFDPVNNRET
jgi:hypothetical protein